MRNAKKIARRIVNADGTHSTAPVFRCENCGEWERDCDCECPECGDFDCDSDECRAMQMEPHERIAGRIVAATMAKCPKCGKMFDDEYGSPTCLACDRGKPEYVGMDEIDLEAERLGPAMGRPGSFRNESPTPARRQNKSLAR